MADTVTYPFVRGDDFSITMTLTDPQNNDAPVDITNWTIASQVRYQRRLIDDLVVTKDDPVNGVLTLSKIRTDTMLWPARTVKCDIQFDRPEGRISSQTFLIEVTEDQTQ
ncbi:structural, host-like protein [Roseovarius Plymouth podovirus 1]|uniref:Structural, host-like protein n=1 Tax=Roseovarius Plymouth podovirus 1 TaxID=926474 RepID=K4Q4Y4_9CAUD|nr:structural, host-like protein [Roseovarius Plymouth podovirus 1]CBX87961.1 structural, host-like protein [Roseovarius Plymouth podovirus 1]